MFIFSAFGAASVDSTSHLYGQGVAYSTYLALEVNLSDAWRQAASLEERPSGDQQAYRHRRLTHAYVRALQSMLNTSLLHPRANVPPPRAQEGRIRLTRDA